MVRVGIHKGFLKSLDASETYMSLDALTCVYIHVGLRVKWGAPSSEGDLILSYSH